MAFHYDAALLRLESHQRDALWGDATVNTCADTYAPRPPYCTYGPRVPEAQGSLPRGATHCTYRVHVSASGVLYVPRTLAPQVNTDEAGVLKMLVLSPANGDADADSALLGGSDIPIAALTFVVQAAAAGTHGAAVSLSILSMTNFGTVRSK